MASSEEVERVVVKSMCPLCGTDGLPTYFTRESLEAQAYYVAVWCGTCDNVYYVDAEKERAASERNRMDKPTV